MNQSSGVIVRTVESGLFVAPPKAHPSNVYVVSYNDGSVRSFSGPPTVVDRRRSRFCYLVDVGEQRVQRSFEVPSAEDAYSFGVEVSATWKVENAETVVRANLSNGNDVVLSRLQDDLWTVVRRFPRSSAIHAEEEARRVLRGPRVLPEGIVILRAGIQIRADDRLVQATQELHTVTHQNSLDAAAMDGLRRMMDRGDDAYVLMHLIRNPNDTAGVLQLMIEAKENERTAHLALLDRMLENNLITDGDAQPLRDRVLGPPALGSWTMRPITSGPVVTGTPVVSISATPPGPTYAAPQALPSSATAAAAVEDDVSSPTATGKVKAWRPLNRRSDPGQE